MQSNADGDYKWILVYEDHLTKYCILLPRTTKSAEETAKKLMFIFSILAAPLILHSDNGREFVNQVKIFISLSTFSYIIHSFKTNQYHTQFYYLYLLLYLI